MNKFLTERNFNLVMATAVLLILVIPVGIANIYLGFVMGESPCLLCGQERFGMVLVGALGIFMLRYGVKIKYIASVFIVSFLFMYTGLRHIGNHAQRDIGMGFAEAVFGLHTYTWAFVVYWIVFFAMALMLFFIREDNILSKEISTSKISAKNFDLYGKVVAILSFVIVFTNTVQFLITDGIPPFGGSGSPARFTWDITKSAQYWDKHHWYENFIDGKSSFLGTNQGPKPYIAGANETKIALDLNYENSPITSSGGKLMILEEKDLGFKAISSFNKGNAGGIAYDKTKDQFAIVSTDAAVYFTDENFQNATASAQLDRPNGMDIPITVDATYYSAGKVVATAYNKTIWGVQYAEASKIDKKIQWHFFRNVNGDLMPMFKSKRVPVMTTRAKKAYILSLAKDPNSKYAYMISIPVKKSPKTILLKYDTTDNQISEETILEFSAGLAVRDGAKVSDYYITGSDIANGKLFAISKSYNALLIIDLASKTIENSYELPNIGDAVSLAIKDDKIYFLSRVANKDKIFITNNPIK